MERKNKVQVECDYDVCKDTSTITLTRGQIDFEDLMYACERLIVGHKDTSVTSVGTAYSGHDRVVVHRKLKIKIVRG